jgi:carboxypeptidase Taq
VHDLSALWNKKYKDYLGVEVPDDRRGILQDVHWSHGSFGYFPTYSMGSFYAAQFFHQAEREFPQIREEMHHGRYEKLHEWLREHIYDHGRRYDPEDLCQKITGESLDIRYFMEYAEEKYARIASLL